MLCNLRRKTFQPSIGENMIIYKKITGMMGICVIKFSVVNGQFSLMFEK